MTDYGVVPDGFNKKTLVEILAELTAAAKAKWGNSIDGLSTAPLGQLFGIAGDKMRELWDVAEAVYRAGYSSSASGEALEGLCELTGCIKRDGTKSTVTLDRLILEPHATLTVGRVVSVGAAGNRFVTTEEVENDTEYINIFSAAAESEEEGAIAGYAGTIDTIVSAVTGWHSYGCAIAANVQPYTGIVGKTLKVKLNDGVEITVEFSSGETAENVVADLIDAGIPAVVIGEET